MNAALKKAESGGFLQFPNVVVLNAVRHRNTQRRAKERKRKSAKGHKRVQKSRNCKQPVV